MDKGILTFRLRHYLRGVPDYRRTAKAVRLVKRLVEKHVRSDNIKLGSYLNEKLWSQGRKNPPNRIQIEITKTDDYFMAELPDAPKPKVEEDSKKKGKKTESKKTSDKKETKKVEKKKTETKATPKKETKTSTTKKKASPKKKEKK
ncbi:hypothetical protein CL622_03450 [archaeon]|nr:hypothetical protein [archaeon]|tara:strand:+ start:592 stop:1029 length:438 start_codon:yes stop_codon:yes gene_type:complete